MEYRLLQVVELNDTSMMDKTASSTGLRLTASSLRFIAQEKSIRLRYHIWEPK
jgi:hypothetical protein